VRGRIDNAPNGETNAHLILSQIVLLSTLLIGNRIALQRVQGRSPV
jgi:hypothetical protein